MSHIPTFYNYMNFQRQHNVHTMHKISIWSYWHEERFLCGMNRNINICNAVFLFLLYLVSDRASSDFTTVCALTL